MGIRVSRVMSFPPPITAVDEPPDVRDYVREALGIVRTRTSSSGICARSTSCWSSATK